jgi:CheY-like chemotaxis protein
VIGSESILVLAESADMRGTLAIAIAEATRCPIVAVPDAAEAVRLARTSRPTVLVVDLGLSGDCAALRALREEPSAAACAAVVLGPAAAREAALAAGATSFVAEPVDLDAVLAAVASALALTGVHATGRAA